LLLPAAHEQEKRYCHNENHRYRTADNNRFVFGVIEPLLHGFSSLL
jgi:hypothetical protein